MLRIDINLETDGDAKLTLAGKCNGTSLGDWTSYARDIENAGADALELNIYFIPTDPEIPGETIERTHLDILKAVKSATKLPVAVGL